MTTFLPVTRCHWTAISSSAFFRLAAAKTTTSPLCAAARSTPAPSARIVPNTAASQDLRVDFIAVSFDTLYPLEHIAINGVNIFHSSHSFHLSHCRLIICTIRKHGSQVAVLSVRNRKHCPTTAKDPPVCNQVAPSCRWKTASSAQTRIPAPP